MSLVYLTRTYLFLPASLDIPSLPARIHDFLHSPQTSLSFPSLIHPHLAAATASIAVGFWVYVTNLNVAKRDRKAGMEDGRYSAVIGSGGADENLKGSVLRVRVAARVRMAVRCGVLFDALMVEEVLELM